MSSTDRKLIGKLGEDFAVGILYSEGYDILERNYRKAHGEIDIICEKNGSLTFVEVKTRRSLDMGRPAESVTTRKLGRMRGAAEYYLAARRMDPAECRFLVMEILVGEVEADGF